MKTKMIGLSISLSSLCLFASVSFAEIYLEPYVSYEYGTAKESMNVTAPITQTISSSTSEAGADFGGKVGYSLLGLIAVGGDYMHGALRSNSMSTGTDDIGAFLQVSVPMLKVSGTYFFSSKATTNGNSQTGNGFKVGVGYTGLPFISINIDYVSINYTTLNDSSITFNSFSASRGAYLAGVSLPLSF